MTKHILISTILIILLSAQTVAQNLLPDSLLRKDLLFYKNKLEQFHPNLYLYTSKEKLNLFFDSLYKSINHPLSEVEFYQKITLTSSLVKDGHTLILPSNSFTTYHNTQSKFLPLQIGLLNNKLYVKMNCTSTKQPEEGSVIDSINGISSEVIISTMLNRQVRDGENLSYAKWILDTYFREYYSYIFGHPDTYRISYRKYSDSITITTAALIKDSIYYYRQKKYPQFYSQNKKGIYINYDSLNQVAILTIKDFHTDILKSEYNQSYTKEIETIFKELLQKKINSLIIDLRNNQGGDVENGVELLKYLIKNPFKVVNEYQKMKNGKLTQGKGPSMGYHKPYTKQFNGQVYVLLNGGSFSNSVIFSSCLKENTSAIFVGTESGGNPNVLAGYANDFELPHSKINVQIPTKRFIMTELKKNNGSGIVPTYIIENTIENNIQQTDIQLGFILSLIRQNRNK